MRKVQKATLDMYATGKSFALLGVGTCNARWMVVPAVGFLQSLLGE
jgi:hypothetical protein